MPSSNPHRNILLNVIGIVLFVSLTIVPATVHADDTIAVSKRIIVGVTPFPPFTLKNAEGRWSGLSFELWKLIAKDIGIQYEIREYDRLKLIIEAIKKNEISIAPYAAVTEYNETQMDLSHTYYRSGLGIAVPLQSSGISWSQSLRQIVSVGGLKLVVIIVLLSLVAGIMIWLAERNRNLEMYDSNFSKGIGHGIWWAMVTMTTVGYGDKAPKTNIGRLIAVFWMFMSIFLIASYTAVITTSLTANELNGRVKRPGDLPYVRVGALSRSETLEYLAAQGIQVIPFENHAEGLQALAADQIDAFVDDELQLKYIIKNDFLGKLHILAETFSQYYIGMAMPPGSQMREQINRTLPKIMDHQDWIKLQERYFGKIELD